MLIPITFLIKGMALTSFVVVSLDTSLLRSIWVKYPSSMQLALLSKAFQSETLNESLCDFIKVYKSAYVILPESFVDKFR